MAVTARAETTRAPRMQPAMNLYLESGDWRLRHASVTSTGGAHIHTPLLRLRPITW